VGRPRSADHRDCQSGKIITWLAFRQAPVGLDTPLAEDSTGSWFERFVFLPYIVFVVLVSLGAGLVVVAVLFSLK
jgi:hypothetical protein